MPNRLQEAWSKIESCAAAALLLASVVVATGDSAANPVLTAAPAPLEGAPLPAASEPLPPLFQPLHPSESGPGRGGIEPPTSQPRFLYAGAYQRPRYAIGVSVDIAQEKPEVGKNDSHSLMELAVSSADGKQVVEVGWTVDPGQFGDEEPHLFVFHWVDGVLSCYNGCGFVATGTQPLVGSELQPNQTNSYGFKHKDGKWQVEFNGQEIGYFPDKLWRKKFDHADWVRIFGEVSTYSESPPCADMGNGNPGNAPFSAMFSRFRLIGDEHKIAQKPALLNNSSNETEHYFSTVIAPDIVRVGGPGSGRC